ncbi:MAG: FAD-dependent monooxygenase [Formosimonas sp.]
MQNHFDALIIGGGIIGNASALALAQAGCQVAVLSSEPALTRLEDGLDARIYALSHSSVQLLKDLRVWDALRAERMCAVRDMQVMGDAAHGERQQGVLHLSAYRAQHTELAWIVEQNNIQLALQQAIQFSPSITVIHEVAEHVHTDATSARVRTQAGRQLSAELLLGCDGAQSWTRQQLQMGTEVFDYAQSGVVANFTCSQPHHGRAYQWFLPQGAVLALLPLPNQAVSMVYSCATNVASDVLAWDEATLSAHISQLSHHIVGELTAQHRAVAFPLKRLRAHRMLSTRAVLLGDAAHTVHPLAGQGLNLGLQDVACARRLLMARPAYRPIHDFVLWRAFERERVAATAQMQGVTHGLNRLFSHTHPVVAQARNLGMNLLDVVPPLKRWLIQTAMGSNHSTS